MAPGIPPNTAQVGGVLFPIVQSLCSAFGSEPGPTDRKIGSYLMLSTYTSDIVVSSFHLHRIGRDGLLALSATPGPPK